MIILSSGAIVGSVRSNWNAASGSARLSAACFSIKNFVITLLVSPKYGLNIFPDRKAQSRGNFGIDESVDDGIVTWRGRRESTIEVFLALFHRRLWRSQEFPFYHVGTRKTLNDLCEFGNRWMKRHTSNSVTHLYPEHFLCCWLPVTTSSSLSVSI